MSTSRRPNDESRVCAFCGRKTGKECGRVECGNRKVVTARIPDECDPNGWSGVHRRTPVDDESWD